MSKHATDPRQTAPSDGEQLPFNLTEVDLATLAQTDEEFIPHSWEELKKIIGKPALGLYWGFCLESFSLLSCRDSPGCWIASD